MRKYKHTKVERKILERANEHLAEMRKEFFKNEDFINPRIEKPAEFEVRGYDTSTKDTPRLEKIQEPQEEIKEDPPTIQDDAPANIQEPEIKNEPMAVFAKRIINMVRFLIQ